MPVVIVVIDDAGLVTKATANGRAAGRFVNELSISGAGAILAAWILIF